MQGPGRSSVFALAVGAHNVLDAKRPTTSPVRGSRYLVKLFGERVAFLVTDPNTAGVHDTVCVDLTTTNDFSDEKPV